MVIQRVSSINTNNFDAIKQNALTTLSDVKKSDGELLTPEQKNTLQNDANDKITNQANEIKSNFQTAKDLDLTRAYYEQQQKLLDIYMQSNTAETKSNSDDVSATKALTDTYSSLYQLHQTIKDGFGQLPSIPEETQPPKNMPEIQPVEILPLTASKQMDTYNSFMMPTTNSYLQLSA
ncbi:MAG: hypothetical protein OCD00_08620 [Colwellia sp.]